MSDSEKRLAPFFDGWDSYLRELKKAFQKYKDPKGTPPEPSSKKFPSLNTTSKTFNAAIKPLLETFFGNNPLIHKGRGDTKTKETYQEIKAFWSHANKLTPPRIRIYRDLETEKDVCEVLASKYPGGRDLVEFLEKLDKERDEELRHILDPYFSKSVLGRMTIGYITHEDVPDIRKLLKDKEMLNLSESGIPERTVWDVIKSHYNPSTFWAKVEGQGRSCEEAVNALIDWEESLRRKSKECQEEKAKEAGEKSKALAREETPAPQVDENGTFELQRDNKNIIKLGTLRKEGQEGGYTLTSRPARAMRELIIATNEGQTDPEHIKERIINQVPEFKEKSNRKGVKHDLTHSEKEVRKAMKIAFDIRYTPWYRLSVKIRIIDPRR